MYDTKWVTETQQYHSSAVIAVKGALVPCGTNPQQIHCHCATLTTSRPVRPTVRVRQVVVLRACCGFVLQQIHKKSK